MKRFWDSAEIVREGDRYAIRLDGRPMRLPGGPLLALESRTLAEAVAGEWQQAGGGKGGTLSVEDVPLTRIAGTAQERVAPDPEITIEALARYAEADMLCYRAATPAALVAMQAERWQPWLNWVKHVYEADLVVTSGITHIAQPAAALAALRLALAGRPAFELAGLGILVPALGSLVLGLAVADGALSGEAAHSLALLDELFQVERWGEDLEAVARRRALLSDITQAAEFIFLSRVV
jgi:chaperone required for assembly of F1-ATPase